MMRYKKMQKRTGAIVLAAALAIIIAMTVFGNDGAAAYPGEESVAGVERSAALQEQRSGHIYLYGESHGQQKILEKEAELWYGYYHEEGLRHLFIEYPYYTAEFLNLWMKSDSDEILDAVYED